MDGRVSLRLRHLFSDTLIYGSARVFASMVGALLIPLYVRRLEVSDYGAIENINVFLALAPPVIGLSLYAAIYRFCPPGEAEKRANFGAVLVGTLIVMSVGALLFAPAAAPMASTLLGGRTALFSWTLFLLASIIATNTVLLTWMNVEMMKREYVRATLGATTLQLLLAVLFVGVARWGVAGFVAASVIAQTMALAYAFSVARSHIELSGSIKRLWPMIVYSAAFVPGAFAVFMMRSSDRYILSILNGGDLKEIGLYAMAEKMALPVALLGAAFSQAFPAFGLRLSQGAASQTLLRDIFRLYVASTAVFSFLCSALSVPFLRLIGARAFLASAQYTPFLALYLSLNSLVAIGSLAVYISGKPRAVISSSMAAAAVNLLANLILIPPYGVWGAVWSTVLAFAVYNIVVFWLGEKDFSPGYPFTAATVTYLVTLTAGWFSQKGPGFALVAAATMAIALFATRIVESSDLARLNSLVRSRRTSST